MRWLVRLIVLVLAVAAVREMRHRQQKVVAIGEDLNEQRRGIEAAETELDASDRSIDNTESRVRELDARITAIEHEHPGGIPDSMHLYRTRFLGHQGRLTEIRDHRPIRDARRARESRAARPG